MTSTMEMTATTEQPSPRPSLEGRGAIERIAFDAVTPGDLPGRILIAPWGDVESSRGRFVVDQEAIDATIAAFAAHGNDLPIDYEHQTLGGEFTAPNGQAPAAGWIKQLICIAPGEDTMPAGLWGQVEWTPQARQQLATRQYRYLSPVALVRRDDRRLIGLHSAALTNKPAISRMTPVVNREHTDASAGFVALREVLQLDESSDDGAVVIAATDRIRGLQKQIDEQRAAERVARAMSAGKLTTAQRAWAESLALRDPAAFDDWLAHAPVVVAAGRTNPPSAPHSTKTSAETIARAARQQYRAHTATLEAICSEEAFVKDALREAGVAQ